MQEGAPPLRHSCSFLDLITHEAPGWGTLLVTDCLDPQARLALSGTCTDTWGLVLETAPHATIRVHVSDPVNMTTLRAVEGAMQARGKLPTKLHLGATRMALLAWALDWLKECTTWLDELAVGNGPQQPLSTTDLATIGRHCLNLRTLHVCAPPVKMPKPSFFRKLERLALQMTHGRKATEGSIARFCAPYIKQLTSLTINGEIYPYHLQPTTLRLLLSPSSPGTHLCTLRLPAVLDDMLLGLLLGCAPALEELWVPGIQLQSDAHTGTSVQWRKLACVGGYVQRLRLSELARLPLAPAMELHTTECVLRCDISQPQAAAMVGRFRALRFDTVRLEPGVAVEYQSAALQAGLHILRTMCRGNRAIIVFSDGWVMHN